MVLLLKVMLLKDGNVVNVVLFMKVKKHLKIVQYVDIQKHILKECVKIINNKIRRVDNSYLFFFFVPENIFDNLIFIK